MSTIQARSRLRQKVQPAPEPIKRDKPQAASNIKQQLTKRSHYWPLLVLSILFYFGIFLLLHYVHPALIQNYLFNNSYLPLQVIFFLGNFLALTFISLDKKIGLSGAVFLSTMLFLRLQMVQLDYLAIAMSLAISSTLFWLLRRI